MHVARGLCEGLHYLHDSEEVKRKIADKGVIHRDLKPENVLLEDTDPPTAKLIDLGLAKAQHATMTESVAGAEAAIVRPRDVVCSSPSHVPSCSSTLRSCPALLQVATAARPSRLSPALWSPSR